MSAESKVMSSVLYPMLLGLVGDLAASDDDSATVANFKRSAVKEIQQQFGLNDKEASKSVHITASVLAQTTRS